MDRRKLQFLKLIYISFRPHLIFRQFYYLKFYWRKTFKSVSTRAPGSRATCHLNDFNETLPVYRVYPKTKKKKLLSALVFFRGEIDHPPGFSWFSPRKLLQNGKMYEALTAMVFNQLLWGFAHIFTSLVDVRCKYQSIWLTACQSTEANIRLCF